MVAAGVRVACDVVCHHDGERPPAPPRDTGAAEGIDLTLTASDGNRFSAYLATPERPTATRIVLLPDTHGLVPFYKELAMMFAATGSVTLAIDYFGRTAGPDAHTADWAFGPHADELRRDTLLRDVRAAVEYLHDGSGPPFLVGFCMGGGTVLHAGTTDLSLAGVVAFYPWIGELGRAPALPEDFATGMRCPVLGLFGDADAFVPTSVPHAFDEAARPGRRTARDRHLSRPPARVLRDAPPRTGGSWRRRGRRVAPAAGIPGAEIIRRRQLRLSADRRSQHPGLTKPGLIVPSAERPLRAGALGRATVVRHHADDLRPPLPSSRSGKDHYL